MFVVTGATGNTGTAVALHLLAEGKKVRGIARSAERLQRLTEMGGEPFAADLTDTELITKAFRGAEGVYVMIPPNVTAQSVVEYQRGVTESVAAALEGSGVKHAVALSSIGADQPSGTGVVRGLHNMEQRLNRISGLNVLHLRCGYFMENLLAQVEMIHKTGMLAGGLDPELRLPMIAARDIGDAAAQALMKLHFSGHQTHELLGAEDLTMRQVAGMIGHVIGNPELKYVQASEQQLRSAMLQMGMSQDFAAQLLEMWAALNSGHMKAREHRDEHNTTPTYFARFVHEEFLPRFRGERAAA